MPQRVDLPTAPILAWWIFEGKRYEGLDGALCENWDYLDHQAQILLSTHNPTWRITNSVEGETDWIGSFFHSITAGQPTYVTRASQVGLGTDERQALFGWLQWTNEKWSDYVEKLGLPAGCKASLPWHDTRTAVSERDESIFRRWAHFAKKSRWPLLRNIVAETFRTFLEKSELDRLPLPTDQATLFELVCMVRVIKAVDPEPQYVRWLDLTSGKNTIKTDKILCRYQMKLNNVLETNEFSEELRTSIIRHGIRIPERCDAFITFRKEKPGFHGILLEMKSGIQQPRTALFQLKCYRAALRDKFPEPLVIWGITENPETMGILKDQLREVASTPKTTDLWIFSNANQIQAFTAAMFDGKSNIFSD